MTAFRRTRLAWDDLRGRSAGRVVGQVGHQLRYARKGAVLARDMTVGKVDSPDARTEMAQIEHDGDAERKRLASMLRGMLATPLDREDLYRLSRSVDDVLDLLRDFVREADLYGLDDLGFATPLLEGIISGVDELTIAVEKVVDEPDFVTRAALGARKADNRVREVKQAALAEILQGTVTVEMLHRRELLTRLDGVGQLLGEAANTLSDAMLKRSH